ncbi:uracil-DNA glycosylase family protein [Pseudophaeobacter arcticus]|uniref:uracil-DNA glycosylase n=1 Tax=Pseudophaeobacter arcticus TaxID=385492 RepID=UPI00041B4FA1|nr:uracil-DNA glycosylase [Pseudophaeobacter arcticus]
MESAIDYWSAKALLEWQVELGATEALCEEPVNRYELAAPAPRARQGQQADQASGQKPGMPPPVAPKPKAVDPVAEARKAAAAAPELPSLRAAMAAFRHCELKMGARNLVFGDGQPGARVMVIGEAPGREEDQQGKPFVGPAGQLLDRMLAAIDLDRAKNVYITNVLPWRPQQNRDPSAEEIDMMLPFLARHVELAQPDILVLMGNISCQAVLGKRGISRLRGHWAEAWGKPVLPMFHPAYLLRQPEHKRAAWADLLELKARLGAPN